MIQESVQHKIRSFVDLIPNNCLITGGHILAVRQSLSINEGTLFSFEAAASIYRDVAHKRVGVGFGILINDIGSTCATNSCTIQKNTTSSFLFPEVYSNVLDSKQISQEDVQFYWERYMRNRGSRELLKRKGKVDNIFRDNQDQWVLQSDVHCILLTRKTATPACPLIMAAYAIEQEKKGYDTSFNFYYVGSDNVENIPNHFMIEKGYEVAKSFGAKIKVRNVYFTNDKVVTNF